MWGGSGGVNFPAALRVVAKSPVRENRPPGFVRGAPGNPRPYRDPQSGESILQRRSVPIRGQTSAIHASIHRSRCTATKASSCKCG